MTALVGKPPGGAGSWFFTVRTGLPFVSSFAGTIRQRWRCGRLAG
jgi:hypothetical protein